MSFLYFSFFQGVLAFLAPCAVALLPAYVASFISRGEQGGESNGSKFVLLVRGLKLAGFSILGILVVYGLAGVLIVTAQQLLKQYLAWFVFGMGIFFIVLGVLMLLGKNVSFSLPIQEVETDNELLEAFSFGMAYALGALGCLFPLFLVVAVQALSAPLVVQGASYIGAYFLGLSLMMVTTIVTAVYSRDVLQEYLSAVLPYVEGTVGVLLIVAGVYIANYQRVLL